MHTLRTLHTLALVAVAQLAACSGCAPPSEPSPDAAAEAGADVVGDRVSDAPDASPPCVHPAVSANCQNGWCEIPAGCFLMGSPSTEYGRARYEEDENPTTLTHRIAMTQYPPTRGLWSSLGLVPSSGLFACAGLAPDCPATDATYESYLAFANALSKKNGLPPLYVLANCTGSLEAGDLFCKGSNGGSLVTLTSASPYEADGYRLPTEAEWEYAARAGTRSAFYGGDIVGKIGGSTSDCTLQPALEDTAWYCMNGGMVYHPVGRKVPNAWGLHDMLGNAGTFVTDPFVGSGYGDDPRTDPWSLPPAGDGNPVLRGGAVTVAGTLLRSAFRGIAPIKSRGPGFRLVRTLKPGMKLSDLMDLTPYGPPSVDGGIPDASAGGG